MLVLFCMRGCGRIERPAFPAPSDYWAKRFLQTSGASRRETADVYLKPSSLRNGFAVIAGGASLVVHLHRWASLEE
jgi:hypothetical protein